MVRRRDHFKGGVCADMARRSPKHHERLAKGRSNTGEGVVPSIGVNILARVKRNSIYATPSEVCQVTTEGRGVGLSVPVCPLS